MILRDGLKDDAWNLTFYVAPAEYVDNDCLGPGPKQPKDRDQVVLEAGLPGSPENYDSEYLDFIIKVFVRGITP